MSDGPKIRGAPTVSPVAAQLWPIAPAPRNAPAAPAPGPQDAYLAPPSAARPSPQALRRTFPPELKALQVASAKAQRVTAQLTRQGKAKDADALAKHASTLAAPLFCQYLAFRGDAARPLEGAALENEIGFALHLRPDAAAPSPGGALFSEKQLPQIHRVTEQLRAVAKDGPARVATLPVVVHTEEGRALTFPLFRVETDGAERFVDSEGRRYDDLQDWREHNTLPAGTMTFASGGHLRLGQKGELQLHSEHTPETKDTVWEHVRGALDVGAAVGGAALLGAVLLGTGGLAVPIAGAAIAAWTAARSGGRLLDRAQHGQTLSPLDGQARGQWLTLAASALGLNAFTAPVRSAAALSGARGAAASAGAARTVARGAVAATVADTAAMADQLALLALHGGQLSAKDRWMMLGQLAFFGGGMAWQARQLGGFKNLYNLPALETQLRNVAAAGPPAPVRPQAVGAPVKRVVVVGGGYGGLAAARRLAGQPDLQVTVLDKSASHTSVTELADYVTRGKDVQLPLDAIARAGGFEFRQAGVKGWDTQARTVTLEDGTQLPYDGLILAVGGRTHHPGPEGVHTLRTFEDASKLRGALLEKLAAREKLPEAERKPVRVAILGSGFTGIELACGLAQAHPGAVKPVLVGKRLNIQGGPRELAYARQRLEALGVELHEGLHVHDATPGRLKVGAKEGVPQGLDADLVVAAMGERGAGEGLATAHAPDKHGRFPVRPTLELEDAPGANVFVVGDANRLMHPVTHTQVPQKVRPAELQGELAADNLLRKLDGEPLREYRNRELGWIANLGTDDAVGQLFGLPVRGRPAALLKDAVTRSHAGNLYGPGHGVEKYLGTGASGPTRPKARSSPTTVH